MKKMTHGGGNMEDVFNFIVENRHREPSPIDWAIQAREYIESQPDTTATFRTVDVFDDDYLSGNTGGLYEGILYLNGAWPLPDFFGGRRDKWVNPNYLHAWKYPLASVECNYCGNMFVVLMRDQRENEYPISGENEHEGCPLEYRAEVKMKMHRQRREIMRSALYFGVRGKALSNRLGLKNSSVGAEYERYAIDREEILEEFMDRRAHTAKYVYPEEGVEKVAKAFGLSKDHLRKDMNNRLDVSAKELSEMDEYQRQDI